MLILMPVAALIFIILGALAVDATVLFLAERELAGAAAAAANDAATRAIDQEIFYADGSIVLDPGLAFEVAAASVAAKRLGESGFAVDPPDVQVTGGDRVTVTLTGRAPYIFSKALPGGPDTAQISARATATAER
ncbi:MAG: hypothetical protein WD232_05435 [Acidimicrobiales bacterium]